MTSLARRPPPTANLSPVFRRVNQHYRYNKSLWLRNVSTMRKVKECKTSVKTYHQNLGLIVNLNCGGSSRQD